MTVKSKSVVFAPRPADWKARLEKLEGRLSLLALDDPLWPGLLELIDQFVTAELEPLGAAGVDDAEAHRGRGRVSAYVDLRRELGELWVRAHSRKQEGKA